MTTGFARARSDEQRAARRGTILRTAAQLLGDGTRVADLSLNELARQVGLAKSNVLRYFETREAVLLSLLDDEYAQWLAALDAELTEDARGEAVLAVDRVAAAVSRTIAQRPVLSELVANSSMVLEHNVSADAAAEYKRTAYAQAMHLVGLVEREVGRLPDPSRIVLAASVNLAIGGAWGMCRPSPGMAEAYERDPELAAMRLDYAVVLRELVATTIAGLLARPVSLPLADTGEAP